jgi:uncharacterized damage-inducible protein DinB
MLKVDERAELIESLTATPVILRSLVRGIDDAAARDRGGERDWSVVELVAHLTDVDARMIARIDLIVREDRPQVSAYQADAAAEAGDFRSRSLVEALTAFEASRQQFVQALHGLTPDQWARTCRHETAGELSIQQFTAHITAHDVSHLAQIARGI